MRLSLEYREKFRQAVINVIGEEEVWVFHPHYENILVSSYGKVKNVITDYIYKQRKTWQNYSSVSIIPTGRRSESKIVHRLVAETFFPFVDYEFYEANHINGDKDDNSIFNINWLTRKENLEHAKTSGLLKPRFGKDNGRYKHTQEVVNDIFKLRENGVPVKNIAKKFKLKKHSVYHILDRRKKCQD